MNPNVSKDKENTETAQENHIQIGKTSIIALDLSSLLKKCTQIFKESDIGIFVNSIKF
jgi:hypothetical protein